MEYIFEYKFPIGIIIITSDETEITGLIFKGESEAEVLSDKRCKETGAIKETEKWLDIYFSGKNPGYIPAINPKGTEFQKLVWKLLLEIPYGKTTTYGERADRS